MDNIRRYRDINKQLEDQSKQNQAKTHMRNYLNTRFKTAFIFAIAEAERLFGHLWNQNEEDETKLSERELFYDKLFEEFRKSVLDNGHLQIRLSDKELDKMNVEWGNVIIEVKKNEQN